MTKVRACSVKHARIGLAVTLVGVLVSPLGAGAQIRYDPNRYIDTFIGFKPTETVYGSVTTVDGAGLRTDVVGDCGESVRYILSGFLARNTDGNAGKILKNVIKKLSEKCTDPVVPVDDSSIPACTPKVMEVRVLTPVIPQCQAELIARNSASIAAKKAQGEFDLAEFDFFKRRDALVTVKKTREEHLKYVEKILEQECRDSYVGKNNAVENCRKLSARGGGRPVILARRRVKEASDDLEELKGTEAGKLFLEGVYLAAKANWEKATAAFAEANSKLALCRSPRP
jgi:hypothetical protein